MTGALILLQVLCIVVFAVAYAISRVSQREAWLWLMGLAALGIVVCAGLIFWSPVLGLGHVE